MRAAAISRMLIGSSVSRVASRIVREKGQFVEVCEGVTPDIVILRGGLQRQ
jgi:hypothetical protein